MTQNLEVVCRGSTLLNAYLLKVVNSAVTFWLDRTQSFCIKWLKTLRLSAEGHTIKCLCVKGCKVSCHFLVGSDSVILWWLKMTKILEVVSRLLNAYLFVNSAVALPVGSDSVLHIVHQWHVPSFLISKSFIAFWDQMNISLIWQSKIHICSCEMKYE